MAWYLDAWKRYFDFSGRALRSHYWYFLLFNLIASIILGFLDGFFGFVSPTGVGLLSTLYTLAGLIPGIAVGVRRLHDTGRTGWWLLILFVPFIGIVVLIIFLVMEGDRAANKYGPPPTAPTAVASA